MSGIIKFAYPEFLLLLIPILWLFWKVYAQRSIFRIGFICLCILLISKPSFIKTTSALDIIVIADRSLSISQKERAKQYETIDLVKNRLKENDRLAIISFNDEAYLEKAFEQNTFSSFQTPYSEHASNISRALTLCTEIINNDRGTRVLILSDGEYTGLKPAIEASRLSELATISYRDISRASYLDLSITGIQNPQQVFKNEQYAITFKVHSSMKVEGAYQICRNGKPIRFNDNEWTAYTFFQGENLIQIQDSSKYGGIQSYEIKVQTNEEEKEQVLDNNQGKCYVRVKAPRPVLIVNQTGQSDNISSILTAGQVETHLVPIHNFRCNLEFLSHYKTLILNNVAILNMTYNQIVDIRRYVEEEGGGLFICGGPASFGSGGYYKSEIDDIIPLSMEQKDKSMKVSTAMSFVLDRSGSMMAPTPCGNTKMDLANRASASSMDLLSPFDSLSVIAVDSSSHVIIEQQNVDNPDFFRNQILSIDSMGGGIYVYTGLVSAGDELSNATQVNKHILLFSDACDSEEPGDYKNLLKDYIDAGITVSVIGLGSPLDRDAGFLKDIAKRGDGRCYFTNDSRQLEQYFTADTMEFSQSIYSEDPVGVSVNANCMMVSKRGNWENFVGRGYNLVYPREDSTICMQTQSEETTPLFAFWNRGIGRVAGFALYAEGNVQSSEDYPEMILDTVHWLCGTSFDSDCYVYVKRSGNIAEVNLEISEDDLTEISQVYSEIFTPNREKMIQKMEWKKGNLLSTHFKLDQTGNYRGVIHFGKRIIQMPILALPSSPEYLKDHIKASGKQVLQDIAKVGKGSQLTDVRSLFKNRTQKVYYGNWTLPLLILLLLIFLLELANERFYITRYLSNTIQNMRGKIPSVKKTLETAHVEKTTQKLRKTRVQNTKIEPVSKQRKADKAEMQKNAAPSEPENQPAQADEMDFLSSIKKDSNKRFRD